MIRLSMSVATAMLCLSLVACSGESQEAQEPEKLTGGDTPKAETRSIDWAAARQARIEAIEAGKSADIVTVQSNGAGSPVPVLLPTGVVMPQNASPTYAPSSDGYFAHYPGPKYYIIVNGTDEVFGDSAADMNEDERANMVFTAMEAGAQVSFSRYGADYLIEFECRILDGEENCISQEEALDVAKGLFVAAAEE
ncbi:MAG: hypothetical protein CME88_18170 [Hirschia sp.]|nr:hypothetical protein [Hirschia sp.]